MGPSINGFNGSNPIIDAQKTTTVLNKVPVKQPVINKSVIYGPVNPIHAGQVAASAVGLNPTFGTLTGINKKDTKNPIPVHGNETTIYNETNKVTAVIATLTNKSTRFSERKFFGLG